jgi:hypothetical protein
MQTRSASANWTGRQAKEGRRGRLLGPNLCPALLLSELTALPSNSETQQAAVSSKARVSLRSPMSSAANMAPMAGLRTSSFAPTTFHVKSETELKAAVNSITMALKPGQTPVVIGELQASMLPARWFCLRTLRDSPGPELEG